MKSENDNENESDAIIGAAVDVTVGAGDQNLDTADISGDDWLAFCYVAGELTERQVVEFESRLADDESLQSAVVDAVGLSRAVFVAEQSSLADPRDITRRRDTPIDSGMSRRFWVTVTACLMVAAFIVIGGSNADLHWAGAVNDVENSGVPAVVDARHGDVFNGRPDRLDPIEPWLEDLDYFEPSIGIASDAIVDDESQWASNKLLNDRLFSDGVGADELGDGNIGIDGAMVSFYSSVLAEADGREGLEL